ncbi:hypothetical protein Droror1_Dr00009038 [Drosera rotundifolia]
MFKRAMEMRDRLVLAEKIERLKHELFDYQYNMGVLILERNDLSSKCEELTQVVAEADEILKRQQVANVVTFGEAEMRVENLRRALDHGRKPVLDLEKALQETYEDFEKLKASSVREIAEIEAKKESKLNRVRQAGTPLVDYWDCLKTMIITYKEYCGALNSYGMKYTRAFANICNGGVGKDQMARVAALASDQMARIKWLELQHWQVIKWQGSNGSSCNAGKPRAILDIIKSGENFRISTSTKMPEQGTCERCGYISSQLSLSLIPPQPHLLQ